MTARLYTLTIDARPVLVMSTCVDPPIEEFIAHDPKLLATYRQQQAFLNGLPNDVHRRAEQQELDDAVATWLGDGLKGMGLWAGEPQRLTWRETSSEEADIWRASLQRAWDTGEQGVGDDSWFAYLVPVTNRGPDNVD
jgi:hypothetical protein